MLNRGRVSADGNLGVADRLACRVTSLDRYCADREIHRIGPIKVDVEGAERVISLKPSPIGIVEVNFQTSAAFSYTPPDLFRFPVEPGACRFFRVVEGWGGLRPMRGFDDCTQSDNVLCVPPAPLARLAPLV